MINDLTNWKILVRYNLAEIKTEIKKSSTKSLALILLVVYLSASFIDYVGTGFGSNWTIEILFANENDQPLKECVINSNIFSTDFYTITWCISIGKIWQFVLLIISIFFIGLMGIFAGFKPSKNFIIGVSIYKAIAFIFGGLSWFFAEFGFISMFMEKVSLRFILIGYLYLLYEIYKKK